MNNANNLSVMDDVKAWLNLSTRWRLALTLASSQQDKLDNEILKHLSGEGGKPSQRSVAELAAAWDFEYYAKQKMNDFMHFKGFDGVMTLDEMWESGAQNRPLRFSA